MTLLQGIAQIEGFYSHANTPNRPQRLNNPGDLNYEPWMAEKYDASLETIPAGYNEKPRFAHFATVQQGWAALHDLLAGPSYANLTITEAINRYAPPSENNTAGYTAEVCKLCGCQPADTVAAVLGSEPV